ncbi:helix-turn-helix domain-containing protein [Mucilaginibacter sp. JRF]|uniref:AraC family transcriptional regulator n=1 Tax=Mucilaginibacter sp. JRF TaxID=2780088 RepID=UPI002104F761|nr:helix-turn-helix domain-containing protein [Mucilaginibacter sp. JRF]
MFETYQHGLLVPLKFNDVVITSMLRGKKVMHLFDEPGFEYIPGESVLIPGNVGMEIDFPEATEQNPTQCLALAISPEKIIATLNFLNERYPKQNGSHWELNFDKYYLYNNTHLATTINKLTYECMSNSVAKDALVDITLSELLVRVIQSQAAQSAPGNKLGLVHTIGEFVRDHITDNINLKSISEKACMSSVSIYRYFKRELGVSPMEFVLTEKLRFAKNLLKDPAIRINEVCFTSGFKDCNYFIRLFKKHEGVTPKQYQLLCNTQAS